MPERRHPNEQEAHREDRPCGTLDTPRPLSQHQRLGPSDATTDRAVAGPDHRSSDDVFLPEHLEPQSARHGLRSDIVPRRAVERNPLLGQDRRCPAGDGIGSMPLSSMGWCRLDARFVCDIGGPNTGAHRRRTCSGHRSKEKASILQVGYPIIERTREQVLILDR